MCQQKPKPALRPAPDADLHPVSGEPGRAAGSNRVRVGLGEHHTRDTRRQKRVDARAGASRVVARLKGNHGC